MKRAICLIGSSAPEEAVEKLSEDYKVYILPCDTSVAIPVSSHPDMILTVFMDKLFCHESYYDINSEIINEIAYDAGLEIVCSSCNRSDKYPEDISFNVLTLGDRLIGRADCIAPELRHFVVIDTRQGYAGCTSLFAAGHVISADPSILKSAGDALIPTFRIRGEGIILEGYDKGFIGGACGVFEDKIYICGDPERSASGLDLKAFCEKSELSLISVYSGDVTDIGGIKFIPFAVAK